MDTSLPLSFRLFQIIVPTFAVIVLCTGLCKCYTRRRREQRRLAEASARAVETPQTVYVIPHSRPEERQLPVPPLYNLAEHYTSPPAYNELVMKPEIPNEPPPAYTESVSPSFVFPEPGRIIPSCPPLRQ